jgi:hypothetical protein
MKRVSANLNMSTELGVATRLFDATHSAYSFIELVWDDMQ